MSSAQNLANLWKLLDKDHEAPNSHKYTEAQKFVGQLANIPYKRVYFTHISKAGNLSVRATQSTGALKSDVVIALIKLRSEDAATHRAARKFVEKTGKPVFMLQRESLDSNKWHPIGGYVLSVDPRGQSLLAELADLFGGPAHEVISVSQEFATFNAIQYLESLGITGSVMGSILANWHDLPTLLASATQSASGLSAAEAAIIARRRDLIADLRSMIADEKTTETDLHKAVKGHYWIFGGRYTGVSERNTLIPMDEFDIPLFCTDGSIHIVELKGSYITSLVKRQRAHLIPGPQVHEAVGQAMNYLRDLDEAGTAMETYYKRNGLEYDLCRARATVVIGNPDHVRVTEDPKRKYAAATRQMIDQAIRTYNGMINRIEVVTWPDLLDAADRTLKFEEETMDLFRPSQQNLPKQNSGDRVSHTASEDGRTIF